jgi:peptidoglycan/LPS O-acetylase OafA/YrhL
MKPRQTNYIPTLDGWRTIAVVMVIGYHGTPAAMPWRYFFDYGARGVNIFFGISGFLICSRLLDEEQRNGKISLKTFYLRRAFRILPPAFLYILIVNLFAAFALMTPPTTIESFASCFFFRNFLPPGHSTSYTGHYWSLAVEEHFYLLWPAFLIFAGSKRALWLTPLLALGFEVWRTVDQSFGITNLADSFYSQRTDRCIDGLLWGCAFALLLRQPGWRERMTRLTITPLWLIYVAALIYVCITPLSYSLIYQSILISLVLTGTLLHPLSLVGRFLEAKPMAWLGRLSYTIYLWQSALFVGRYQDSVDLQVWPINLITLLVIAVVSYYLIEKPLIAFGRRLTRKQKLALAAEAAPVIRPRAAATDG